MVEHRSIVNHITWITRELWRGQPETFLQVTSASFDAAGWEFYGPLTVGGTLVIAPPDLTVDAESVAHIVNQYDISVIGFTPPVLRELLADGFTSEAVRWVVCGGEPLPASLVEDCRAALPGASVYNLYGPTETCINSTFFACDGADDAGAVAVPIGRPIANTRLFVVGEGGG
ncbi:AMP-binding protein, partial [Melissospora conviva]|uniref:AMP-binding protein n=1 Tax=Melissospora conviva TaxID=3388432 RepID=UPI003C166DA7